MAKKLFPALLDLVDHEITERVINNSSSKRKLYVKYSREECYKIRKYASEDGPIATVSKFQHKDLRIRMKELLALSEKDMN